MTSFVEIFSILAPKSLYIKMQSLFFTFKLVTKSPFLSSDVRVVLRPGLTLLLLNHQWNQFLLQFINTSEGMT